MNAPSQQEAALGLHVFASGGLRFPLSNARDPCEPPSESGHLSLSLSLSLSVCVCVCVCVCVSVMFLVWSSLSSSSVFSHFFVSPPFTFFSSICAVPHYPHPAILSLSLIYLYLYLSISLSLYLSLPLTFFRRECHAKGGGGGGMRRSLPDG